MLEVNFVPFPVITTERLMLRQAKFEDAPEFLFLRSDIRVLQYIGKEPITSLEEAQIYVQLLTDNLNDGVGITWAITLKGEDKMIGTIALWRWMKESYRAEIGYVMHPDHSGKGIMQEAMMAVTDHGFNKMGLHSIEASVNPANVASLKVVERAGFIKEGHFRDRCCFRGVFSDRAIYSLIAPK